MRYVRFVRELSRTGWARDTCAMSALRVGLALAAACACTALGGAHSRAASEEVAGRVAWSFQTDDGESHALVATLNGSSRWSLGHGRVHAWSPDGRQLLVETDTAITVVDVTTRSRRTLLPLDYGSVEAAFWSSDGSQVLVEVELYAGCGPRRFLLAADGTSRQRLRLPVAGYLLDWPPEAQRVLVLAAKRECSDRYTMPFGAGEPPPPGALVSLALDGSNRVVLARNVAHAGNAASRMTPALRCPPPSGRIAIDWRVVACCLHRESTVFTAMSTAGRRGVSAHRAAGSIVESPTRHREQSRRSPRSVFAVRGAESICRLASRT